MADLKTRANDASVEEFVATITETRQRQDARVLLDLMRQATASEPRMWGDSIIGFGSVHLKYASGRAPDWFKIDFSPRKQKLVLYNLGGFDGYEEMLARLGEHKSGEGCLYINRLGNIDLAVLKALLGKSAKER